MDLQFEHRLVQNPSIGAQVLFEFCAAYYDELDQGDGPDLPTTMLVLPIVFHRRSAMALKGMQRKSGFLKALVDRPDLPAGLQLRLQATSGVTFQSLRFLAASRLIDTDWDDPWPRYIPQQKSLPVGLRLHASTRDLGSAAKRLGWWLAHEDLTTICRLLHVRF